jgi:hypothetical protein
MAEGRWIQTFTGRKVFPLDLKPEDIDELDIAHSLARLCRFNGHCREFYSVAQHSIHVASMLTPEFFLAGLLHDASEAYLGDLSRPLKVLPEFAFYRAAEERAMAAIARRFGFELPLPWLVQQADLVMLATEKATLMGPEPDDWGPLPPPEPDVILFCWGVEEAEDLFLRALRNGTRIIQAPKSYR